MATMSTVTMSEVERAERTSHEGNLCPHNHCRTCQNVAAAILSAEQRGRERGIEEAAREVRAIEAEVEDGEDVVNLCDELERRIRALSGNAAPQATPSEVISVPPLPVDHDADAMMIEWRKECAPPSPPVVQENQERAKEPPRLFDYNPDPVGYLRGLVRDFELKLCGCPYPEHVDPEKHLPNCLAWGPRWVLRRHLDQALMQTRANALHEAAREAEQHGDGFSGKELAEAIRALLHKERAPQPVDPEATLYRCPECKTLYEGGPGLLVEPSCCGKKIPALPRSLVGTLYEPCTRCGRTKGEHRELIGGGLECPAAKATP